ncbi:hypothetical protein, partial [Streptosporangium fragile]
MRSTVYLHPWDVVGDPAAPERVARLGAGSVALAAAYHSVRACTPHHPRRRVVDARHAALYVPVRAGAWAGSRLVPESGAAWAGGENAFGRAREALARHGLAVDAWVVLTHSTILGERHPELTVRNAFGDRYPYALCPSDPDVRAYCGLVVAEVLAQGAPGGLVVEACGPLGIGHQGHHEKTAGADWTGTDEALLSICLCRACRRALAAEGVEPDRLGAVARGAVGAGHGSVAEALGILAEPVLRARQAAVGSLRDEVIRLARRAGVTRLVFHASADPWATAPGAAVLGAGDRIDTYVAGCWGTAEAGAATLAAMRGAVRDATRAAVPGGTRATVPEGTRATVPEGTRATVPEGT